MVRLAPERVKKLVLIATSARGDTEEQKARKIAAVDFLNSTNTFRGLSRYSITGLLHTDRANDDVLINRIREMSVRLGRDVFTQQSLLVRDSDLNSLSQIKCPTLILAGQDDRIRSYEEAIELHKGISGSQLQVINHCGHMLPLDAPELVATSIDRFCG